MSRLRHILLKELTGNAHLYSRLKIEDNGAGYCHYPIGQDYDDVYFGQLTAEKEESLVRRLVTGLCTVWNQNPSAFGGRCQAQDNEDQPRVWLVLLFVKKNEFQPATPID